MYACYTLLGLHWHHSQRQHLPALVNPCDPTYPYSQRSAHTVDSTCTHFVQHVCMHSTHSLCCTDRSVWADPDTRPQLLAAIACNFFPQCGSHSVSRSNCEYHCQSCYPCRPATRTRALDYTPVTPNTRNRHVAKLFRIWNQCGVC
jgi:hypothetical protein